MNFNPNKKHLSQSDTKAKRKVSDLHMIRKMEECLQQSSTNKGEMNVYQNDNFARRPPLANEKINHHIIRKQLKNNILSQRNVELPMISGSKNKSQNEISENLLGETNLKPQNYMDKIQSIKQTATNYNWHNKSSPQ